MCCTLAVLGIYAVSFYCISYYAIILCDVIDLELTKKTTLASPMGGHSTFNREII